MSAPASRPVHPCVLSITDGTRGAEYSTFARIDEHEELPNLVTAAASSINIYRVATDGKLELRHAFGQLAGNIVSLSTLRAKHRPTDALLVGFAGEPRLSVLTVDNALLTAVSLIDLTPGLQDRAYSSTSTTDMVVSIESREGKTTVVCILGGGISVAVLDIVDHHGQWRVEEPYFLPLGTLNLPHHQRDITAPTMSTGFGDITASAFLKGYLEPVVVLLHSGPSGRVWPGRLGREGGGAPPMYATALIVGVEHRRTAVLWSIEVGADAIGLETFGKTRCLVVGVNSLLVIESGRVACALAMNGWARSTAPESLQSMLEPNPLVKLSIDLSASAVAWVSEHSAVVALRTGQLYVLQQSLQRWTLLPTGQTLGAIGEVEHLTALPFPESRVEWMSRLLEKTDQLSVGLVFAGSRLGSSLLLGYSIESVKVPWENPIGAKAEVRVKQEFQSNGDSSLDDDYDRILRLEEEALYAPTQNQQEGPDVIPDSDEELETETKRQRIAKFTVLRGLAPLDIIVNLGPLGQCCEGPVSNAPSFLTDAMDTTAVTTKSDAVYGAPAYIFPAGFGSSGGLALATIPGRDDRMILAEDDCLNVDCVFSLSKTGVVILGMSEKSGGGMRVLRLQETSQSSQHESHSLEEVDLDAWCSSDGGQRFANSADVFRSPVYAVGEFADGSIVILTSTPADMGPSYVFVFMKEEGGKLSIMSELALDHMDGNMLRQVTPFVASDDGLVLLCLWTFGQAQVFSLSLNGGMSSNCVGNLDAAVDDPMEVAVDDEIDEEERKVRDFYLDQQITCMDVFRAPTRLFAPSASGTAEASISNGNSEPAFDEDEEELYGSPSDSGAFRKSEAAVLQGVGEEVSDEESIFVAICRQSGKLEIYQAQLGTVPQLCWTAVGCGQGINVLERNQSLSFRQPRSHLQSAQEIRFFTCGPSLTSKSNPGAKLGRSLCLSLIASAGDVELYVANKAKGPSSTLSFQKRQLRAVSRPSQEQVRHNAKLVRKRIIAKDVSDALGDFTFNKLHRFFDISGQDGLFAASARPFWIVGERGRPTMLNHRTRHAAPAGGKPRPVSGFCSGVIDPISGASGFLTLHERVGRIGSQRLTVFHGLSHVFETNGLLSGTSGMCIEKIHLGVTVRKIVFIDDPNTSSSEHPLYAVLVSREVDADQSMWNSDGLTDEERQQQKEAKESARIKKQVEADLGGFDLENEWAEEIEREDCFKIDIDLGGAPPIRDQSYSLWIVDAANKWMVVDSFELDQFEHGLALEVMHLTEFPEEPGNTSASEIDLDDLSDRLFITVGTGCVDHNGEDVSAKGRALLFELSRPPAESGKTEEAELSLKYVKEIFHGPVCSVSCLVAESRKRLVIGAGADVNIEQWGNDKLTQVGFFRATMEVLDILLFKNFFLLSDAYDSLYFLVWRESDKSLTLLAKDYDPIPVFAAGLMSRGPAMTFLCHDDRQNLQFFQYAPGEPAARGGNKLVCRGDFHLGAQTTAFSSHFCRSSLLAHSATPTSTLAALKQQDTYVGRTDDDQRLGAFFGTTDGGIGAVVPISEPVYWRLTALQSVMANALESDCALSHRAWRLYKRTARRGGCRNNDRKKGVIDGDLVVRYADLPKAEQEDLASAIGSTVDLILDNILELQCSSMMM